MIWSVIKDGLTVVVPLIVIGFNVAMFLVIKFNDMKHMEDGVNDIKATLKKIDEKTDSNSERLAKIEGKCLANHG